ncbi:hypothetical protein [Sphingobacterium faecale]|uniref:DUF4350 domain-containing protein n=1 Tax=Sphingobacterium faecale TaxID=2803775 RepID=A0ABS1R587_9SPHI|nr:hypothetical protein [Sphingobacterium faecale]MBL1409404.1 hypothetical protein [Sphingobacterium faecale]
MNLKRILTIGFVLFFISVLFGQNTDVICFNTNKNFKLLFDYYHHNLPSTKVGNHIVTGSWIDSDGRYGWNDFVHTNTLDHAYTILSKDYAISMSRVPYSDKLLKGIDGVVIFALDNPSLIPTAKVLSDNEIEVLHGFVRKGGSLMVMLNAIEKNRFNESFEMKQTGQLLEKFGLSWNNDDTHYSDNVIAVGHPYFYDVPVFHYGAGCTLKILPNAKQPEILLSVYSDSTYKDRKVKGSGIVSVRYGKGKVILVGDAGSWTGNISRPWADNGKVLTQLFRYMKPDNDVIAMDLSKARKLVYEVNVAGLQAIPSANTLSEIVHPKYEMFNPRPTTQMPYFEASAEVEINTVPNILGGAQANVSVRNFKWFDKNEDLEQQENVISLIIGKQGKVVQIDSKGVNAQWLAPDIALISALLPANSVQSGDSWQSMESIRIPALRATDLPSVSTQNLNILYAQDIVYKGKPSRYLISMEEAWLSDWGISLANILPEEVVNDIGGINFRFLHDRGGKILFKREQWVDQKTGVVLEAKQQTRIITWIQDNRKAVGISNLDKDNETIVSIANITTFTLKD